MKNEKGAATILEYAIVLPIVLTMVFALITVGFTLHQKAVMESVTHRAAILISRKMADPNYDDIVSVEGDQDMNDIVSAMITEESIKTAPYRYLLNDFGSDEDAEAMVRDWISRNQIFIDTAPEVSVVTEFGVFPKVTVTATQDFEIPSLMPGISLPPLISIETESVVYVNQPAEFIRNADYIIEMITKAAAPIIDGLGEVISKISFFKDMK